MDFLALSPTVNSQLELVSTLRLLVTNVTQSSDNSEQQCHLQQMVVVLRSLRACVPSMSRHLSDEVKKALAEIGPALRTVGTFSAGVSAVVAVAGLFMQSFCKDEENRRTGREMARVGGAIALGSIEVVKLIKEIVKEIENDLAPMSQTRSISLSGGASRGWSEKR